jgi:hypothetical protein
MLPLIAGSLVDYPFPAPSHNPNTFGLPKSSPSTAGSRVHESGCYVKLAQERVCQDSAPPDGKDVCNQVARNLVADIAPVVTVAE